MFLITAVIKVEVSHSKPSVLHNNNAAELHISKYEEVRKK